VFGNAGKEKAMKVIIDAEGVAKPKAAATKKRELAEIWFCMDGKLKHLEWSNH